MVAASSPSGSASRHPSRTSTAGARGPGARAPSLGAARAGRPRARGTSPGSRSAGDRPRRGGRAPQPALARRGQVDWRGWDPFGGESRRASLRYVWDANYEGIEFPARPTVVLRVRAPKRAEYWRVSTLETFAADRWIENLYPVDIGGPRRMLPADPLRAEAAMRNRAVAAAGRRRSRGWTTTASRPRASPRESTGRPSGGSRSSPAASCAPGGTSVAARSTPSGATRRARRPLHSRRSKPRYPDEARAVPRARAGRFPGFGAADARAASTRLRATSATSRCGRTARSGRRRSGAPRARARRTRRRCPRALVPRATVGSSTRSGRRSAAGAPPLVDFVEVTQARATASTTPGRWP